jgi:hypothetical protein
MQGRISDCYIPGTTRSFGVDAISRSFESTFSAYSGLKIMTEVSFVSAISRNLWNAANLVEKVQLLTTHYLHSTTAAHLEAAQRQLKRNEVFGTSLDTSCQLHSLTMVDPYKLSVPGMLKHAKPGYA